MENVQVHQIRVGPSWMDPLVLFLKEGVLPHEKGEAKKKYGGKLIVFGCPRSKSCTNALSLDHTCFVFISRQWSHFWKSCTGGYMEVIRGADRYHIELLSKGINGLLCKKKCKSMLKSVIDDKDLLRTFISLGVYSILYLVHGHLLNGAWIL